MSHLVPLQWANSNSSYALHGGIAPALHISCTVVIKLATSHYGTVPSNQQAAPAISSTNFFEIAVASCYLVNRQEGATSIMADSLIFLLREHILQPTIRLRPLFRDSIQGLSPGGTTISLATTRIPEFGDDMESPHTGYQGLSTNITGFPTMQYGGAIFDPNQEIMSMASVSSNGSEKLADFAHMWQTLLRPSYHFFLIFQIDDYLPPWNSSIGVPSTATMSSGSNQIYMSTPSTAHFSPINALGLTGAVAGSAHLASPAYGLGEAMPLFERQLLAAIGLTLTSQDIKDAMFVKDKPLFQNYKNWLAMARLLDPEVINLPGLTGEAAAVKFPTDEAAEILRYFKWAPTSYYKKRRLFIWAYTVACMVWNGPTGMGIHHNWKGIVYLWGRGGAFERNSQPERQSNNPDERYASKLTQDIIEKKKSDISRHTHEG